MAASVLFEVDDAYASKFALQCVGANYRSPTSVRTIGWISKFALGPPCGAVQYNVRAVLARLPGYRLSKFQDCLPERFALEVIVNYLLDVEGTVRWLNQAGEANHV